MEEIKDIVEDLGWEYQRMSSSGQESYKKLCLKLGWDFEWNEESWYITVITIWCESGAC